VRLVEQLQEYVAVDQHVQRHRGAVVADDAPGAQRLVAHLGQHVGEQRVAAVHHERLRPRRVAAHVDQPGAQTEHRQRDAAGEDRERRRPQRLVDRQPGRHREPGESAQRADGEQRRDALVGPAGADPVAAGEHAAERRRGRAERAEQALRVPALVQQVSVHQQVVEQRADVVLGAGPRAGRAVDVHQDQQRGLGKQQRDDRDHRRAHAARQDDQRGEQIAQRDPLQDPGDAQVHPGEVGKSIEQHADREDQRCAPHDLDEQALPRHARVGRLAHREPDRDADDEQERRVDHIGDGAAVPRRVAQDGEAMLAPAGRVDQDHRGDGDAAEGVEREKARPARCRLRPLAPRAVWPRERLRLGSRPHCSGRHAPTLQGNFTATARP
jgi:hypothetical protein